MQRVSLNRLKKIHQNDIKIEANQIQNNLQKNKDSHIHKYKFRFSKTQQSQNKELNIPTEKHKYSQFHRNSQSYDQKNSILRNIISSNQKKRWEFFNKLIKVNNNTIDKDNRKIKFNNRTSNKENQTSQSNDSIRKGQKTKTIINQLHVKSSRSHKKQTDNFQLMMQLSHRKKSPNRVTNKQIQYLRKSFNERIKQIKMRKYYHKDQIQAPTHLFQAYGSTMIGSKHQQNQDSIYFSQGIYVLSDGHGSNGKQISNFIAETVHNSLNQCLEERKIDETIIVEAYRKIDLELDNSNFDLSFSGCTCVTVFRHQNILYCISLGDSRAIMSRGYMVSEISVTHKPSKPQEKQRIQNYGGIVRQSEVSKDKFVGPMRIWAPGKNSWGPGLAVSRAFGDKASRRYGLVSVPEITKITLTFEQEFIVIGSDGLFDFFSDQDIHQFVRKLLKEQIPKSQIPHELVKQARKKWQQQSDDISCIIIFM